MNSINFAGFSANVKENPCQLIGLKAAQREMDNQLYYWKEGEYNQAETAEELEEMRNERASSVVASYRDAIEDWDNDLALEEEGSSDLSSDILQYAKDRLEDEIPNDIKKTLNW